MALNLSPLKWDWARIQKGDTFPATNITESLSTTNLSRIKIDFYLSGSTTSALTLDSNVSGVTINTATSGAWDFTIAAIQTAEMTAGIYSYELKSTDAGGVIRTEFIGTWEITD